MATYVLVVVALPILVVGTLALGVYLKDFRKPTKANSTDFRKTRPKTAARKRVSRYQRGYVPLAWRIGKRWDE